MLFDYVGALWSSLSQGRFNSLWLEVDENIFEKPMDFLSENKAKLETPVVCPVIDNVAGT